MMMTKTTHRFFPNLEEIPEESRCSTIMKERKEEEGENDINKKVKVKMNESESESWRSTIMKERKEEEGENCIKKRIKVKVKMKSAKIIESEN